MPQRGSKSFSKHDDDSMSMISSASQISSSFFSGMHAGACLGMPPVDLAYAYVDAINQHDLEAIRRLCAPTCEWDFGKEFMLRVEDHEAEAQRMFDSFPDYHFSYQEVFQLDDETAIVGHFQGSGTHTGLPFGFGPFPEIPATGKKIKNDPETITFKVKDGHIVKVTIRCLVHGSEKSGPPGMYRQIGGFPF